MNDTVLNKEADRMTELSSTQATVIDIQPHLENNTRLIEYHHSASAKTGVFILGNETAGQLPIPDTPENRKVDYAIQVSGKSMEPPDADNITISEYDNIVCMGKVIGKY